MRLFRLVTNSFAGTLNSVSSPRRWTSQNSARASGDSPSIRSAISSSIHPPKGRGRDTPKDTPARSDTLRPRRYLVVPSANSRTSSATQTTYMPPLAIALPTSSSTLVPSLGEELRENHPSNLFILERETHAAEVCGWLVRIEA